jgi:hypothetical protein
MRPSDGVFLTPRFLWKLLQWPSRRQPILTLALAAVLCSGWIVPTVVAFAGVDQTPTAPLIERGYTQKKVLTDRSVLFHGFTTPNAGYRNATGAADRIRALAIGLAAHHRPGAAVGSSNAGLLDLDWIIPGVLFFALIFLAHATYLNFCTPALVLLGFLSMAK